MKKLLILLCVLLISITGFVFLGNTSYAQANKKQQIIVDYIDENFKELKTPGLSIGIIENGEIYFINYGYADTEDQIVTSEETNFEIGSCTKAFTALAILKLNQEGFISLDDSVIKYFPKFKCSFENKSYDITIEQLLHHTSGVGTDTISLFRPDNSEEALRKIVTTLSGIELKHQPGKKFEYATINYDILGAIIEQVSGLAYEDYIKDNLLNPIGMTSSYVGSGEDENASSGYKVNFYKPREYEAPVFRNNYPAGYLVSSTKDMIKWLNYQLGNQDIQINSLLELSHKPNKEVDGMYDGYYGAGWFISPNKYDEIHHEGQNPNFAAFVSFCKKANTGIVVLSNSNSTNFHEFAHNIALYLYGDDLVAIDNRASSMDNVFSTFTIIFAVISVLLICYWGIILFEVKKNKRSKGLEKRSIRKLITHFMILLPFYYGLYLLPKTFAGTDWYTATVWGPDSFVKCVTILISLSIISFITHIMLLFFPYKNQYFKHAPEVLTLGTIAGLCNAIIIFLITNALNTGRENLKYNLYYFGLALVIYISGRRSLEIRLAEISQLVIKSLRETIFDRLFKTKYEDFEKIESGQLITTITDDINKIRDLAGIAVVMATSIITIIAAFVYLATISAFGTLMALAIIIVVASVYGYFNDIAVKHFEEARDTQNKFMAKIEALIGGYKDLTLHRTKKLEYRKEVSEVNEKFRLCNLVAFKMFVNAFMLGESLFIIVLGLIVFGFSYFFMSINEQELTSFVMILLYILGPINQVMSSIPRLAQINVSIERVKKLLKELPEIGAEEEEVSLETKADIKNLTISNLEFKYDKEDEEGFKVGPIDMSVNKGEVLFIIGGNGSGKSTLIKMITGLYKSQGGSININNKKVSEESIGEYISTVFADSYLFDRFYNTRLEGREANIKEYLASFELQHKVQVKEGVLSTTSLSTGQKKRLHLMRCYLEDRPIFIFDELAADQDPYFRKYFYRTLLPKMRKEGKIVIAVTHDDHYFDVADKVMKLDMGHMDNMSAKYVN